MQFSIDRLFQMIEERFGRRVANGLLLLVVAALAILALNIIITQGLAPTAGLVSEFMRGNDIRISWFGLVSFLISALLPGFSVWAGYRFFVQARQAAHNKKMEDATTQFETMAKEWEKLAKSRDQENKRLLNTVSETHDLTEKATEAAKSAADVAGETVRNLEQRLQAVDERLSRLEGSRERRS